MKHPIFSFVTAMALAAPVCAQASDATHDWSGAYVGLSYGSTGGDLEESLTTPFVFSVFDEVVTESSFGGFVGYNWQRGNFVFGGEFVYLNLDLPLATQPNNHQRDIFELRGRLGYAINSIHIYGLLGYSKSKYDTQRGPQFNLSGPTVGVGVEYAINDNFFVGLEASRRQIEGGSPTAPTRIENKLNSVQFRLGYSF